MAPLLIEASEFTPKIIFDPDNSFLEITGFSRPEDVKGFYQKFFDWLNAHKGEILSKANEGDRLKMEFHLVYFNSASSKCLLDIVVTLNKLYAQNIEVIWYYEQGDEDLLEAGEEFSDAVEIPFEFVEVEDDE